MKREDVAMQRARGAERQENKGRDFSKFNPIYEARVMGYCVDVAVNLPTLRAECLRGKNGQAHQIEVWAIDTSTGIRRLYEVWPPRSAQVNYALAA